MRCASILLLTCSMALAAGRDVFGQPPSSPAHQANARLGRGVNFGNALEAPVEGQWGMKLQPEFFRLVKEAGFDTVRLPVKWSAHAAKTAPHTIDPDFFARVDWALDQAEKNKLNIVLNVHHFEELDKDPAATKDRFLAIWKQVAERYRARPASLYFELHNEPHDKLTNELWNALAPEALKVVRATNPDRMVIIGPGMWNNVNELPKLVLPEDDRNIIVTFHYYLPFKFTHQGASWAQGSEAWLGTTWTATREQVTEMRRDFDKAANWAKEHDRPLFLGEFGAYSRADMDSRVAWTSSVVREARARGFSLAYWEFGAGFGIYDRDAKQWRVPLRDALLKTAP